MDCWVSPCKILRPGAWLRGLPGIAFAWVRERRSCLTQFCCSSKELFAGASSGAQMPNWLAKDRFEQVSAFPHDPPGNILAATRAGYVTQPLLIWPSLTRETGWSSLNSRFVAWGQRMLRQLLRRGLCAAQVSHQPSAICTLVLFEARSENDRANRGLRRGGRLTGFCPAPRPSLPIMKAC